MFIHRWITSSSLNWCQWDNCFDRSDSDIQLTSKCWTRSGCHRYRWPPNTTIHCKMSLKIAKETKSSKYLKQNKTKKKWISGSLETGPAGKRTLLSICLSVFLPRLSLIFFLLSCHGHSSREKCWLGHSIENIPSSGWLSFSLFPPSSIHAKKKSKRK